jgi:hypothetical protein
MTLILFKQNISEIPEFVEHLRGNKQETVTVSSTEEFHRLCRNQPRSFETVIADEEHLAVMKDFIMAYPMLNYGLISKQSSDIFHEMTEGYGFLPQLPSPPKKKDAEMLLERLKYLAGLGTTGKREEKK